MVVVVAVVCVCVRVRVCGCVRGCVGVCVGRWGGANYTKDKAVGALAGDQSPVQIFHRWELIPCMCGVVGLGTTLGPAVPAHLLKKVGSSGNSLSAQGSFPPGRR